MKLEGTTNDLMYFSYVLVERPHQLLLLVRGKKVSGKKVTEKKRQFLLGNKVYGKKVTIVILFRKKSNSGHF